MRQALFSAFLLACAPAALSAAPAAEPAIASVKSDAHSIIPALATRLEDNFVFPDVAKRYAAAIRAKNCSIPK